MKGVVFNLLEELVRREHGEAAWDGLLDAAGVEGAYTSLGSYPDAELYRLVGAAARALGRPADEVVRWFGRGAFPLLVAHAPEVLRGHTSARSFVLTLNSIIHPEVRKLYPGADVPDFEFDTCNPAVLVMTYRSPRRLCAFAEGLVLGAADRFGETATVTQSACMHRGDPACVLHLAFA